ncbi:MAG: DUF5615 family PIN-like protein [Armatimonadetes bacterium]|nr:DUF5615 family PIN-like protein [Armatimonadota bacterium]
MKLLLDQGLPRSAAAILREYNLDAIHVGEIGGARWADIEIIRRAREDGRVIVTLDADFHAILVLSGVKSPSVIRIRIQALRGEELTRLVLMVVDRCNEELKNGAMVTVQEGRLRVRLLPLVS